MTNDQVKAQFRRQLSAKATNLVSDGVSLWSYGWWEVARWVDGVLIHRVGKSYSTTTSTKHRSGLHGIPHIPCNDASIETPAGQAKMEV